MTVYKNGAVFRDGKFVRADITADESLAGDMSIDLNGLSVFPGFVDVHTHLREPGFSYKETIKTGALAAASAGYCAICAMPNLEPAPDCYDNLKPQLDIIARDARIRVVPYGTITKSRAGRELADIIALAPHVAGFSDDGGGVQSDEIMARAMSAVKSCGGIIAAHCEDERYPAFDPRSEWKQLARDLDIARATGCRYHACHISCRESVDLIRRAKAEGLDVTCETAPHYLLFDGEMIDDSPKYRMNPPIRARADREALIAGALDGTIDILATDHAPHADAEKYGGMNGVIGVETAFPAMYTAGILPLERLIDMMSFAPKRRFGFDDGAHDFCCWDLDAEYVVDRKNFKSLSGMSPFEGMRLKGKCVINVVGGKRVYAEDMKNA